MKASVVLLLILLTLSSAKVKVEELEGSGSGEGQPTVHQPVHGSYINFGGLGGSKNGDCFKSFPQLKRRFSWEQLEFFCQQKRAYEDVIQEQENEIEPFTEKQLAYLGSLKMDLNYSDPNPPVRKEIRMLTDSERRLFFWSLRHLRRNTIDGVSKFDILVLLSHPSMAPGAYVGAAFLPWHREYLRTFEMALRQEYAGLTIPYWDSTLDAYLPDPTESVVWHPRFFGNGNGRVVTGPFMRNAFRLPKSNQTIPLTRNVGANGSLLTDEFLDFFLSRPTYRELTACVDLGVERANRRLHEWVGGAMSSIYYSAQDFLFLVHYAFLDYLWEEFRGNRTEGEGGYPTNREACTKFHWGSAPMRPFEPLKNAEGLSEAYTEYYQYAPRPLDCGADGGCGSDYLFCHRPNNRCMSRIRLFGNCSGLADYEPCFQAATCLNGRCQIVKLDNPEEEEDGSGEKLRKQTMIS